MKKQPLTIPGHILEQFPSVSSSTYLNSCARGLLPLNAKIAVEELLADRMAGSTDKNTLFDVIRLVRSRFSKLISANADEIAITKNVSEGLSIIAASMSWRSGDNVVVCIDLEHPNNVYPWINLRERAGIEIRTVAARNGHIPTDEMCNLIDDRTRLASVSSVSFSPGFRTNLASLGKLCQKRDVFLLVDAAQSIGILDTNVNELGIDGLAVSTQKGLLGLYGFGFLYCRKHWAERLTPVYLARFGVDLGEDAHEAAKGTFQYKLMPGALRFDLGNYNYPGAVAANASLAILAEVGTPAIDAHVTTLSHRLVAGLLDLGLPVAGGAPGSHLGSIVSVGSFGEGGHDSTDDPETASLYQHLTKNDVILTIRQGMLRMAFHLYNTENDVDHVIELAQQWSKSR